MCKSQDSEKCQAWLDDACIRNVLLLNLERGLLLKNLNIMNKMHIAPRTHNLVLGQYIPHRLAKTKPIQQDIKITHSRNCTSAASRYGCSVVISGKHAMTFIFVYPPFITYWGEATPLQPFFLIQEPYQPNNEGQNNYNSKSYHRSGFTGSCKKNTEEYYSPQAVWLKLLFYTKWYRVIFILVSRGSIPPTTHFQRQKLFCSSTPSKL